MDREIMLPIMVMFITGSPVWLTMIVVRHRQKMREMELKHTGTAGLADNVGKLRREIAELRETTTRFDMSHDNALERLERRLQHVEEIQLNSPIQSPKQAETIEATLRRM